MTNYLENAKKQFLYYKGLGEKSMAQVDDEFLFHKVNEESNSIAMIVQHIAGNMLSRWTDFLLTDGEKEWRNRDSEFEEVLKNREEMMVRWNEGWTCLESALDTIEESDLDRIVYIRNMGLTAADAIHRQLAHYSYHIGQIVLLAKMFAGQWTTLSIAKNESTAYNQDRFSREKALKHFTDDTQ